MKTLNKYFSQQYHRLLALNTNCVPTDKAQWLLTSQYQICTTATEGWGHSLHNTLIMFLFIFDK